MSGKKFLIIAKFENCISKNKANVHTCTGTLVPSYFYHKKSTMLVTARNPLRFPSFENEKMLSSILWIVAPWIGGSAYIFPLNTQLANTKVHKYKNVFEESVNACSLNCSLNGRLCLHLPSCHPLFGIVWYCMAFSCTAWCSWYCMALKSPAYIFPLVIHFLSFPPQQNPHHCKAMFTLHVVDVQKNLKKLKFTHM